VNGPGVPPFGGSSMGTGGNYPVAGDLVTSKDGTVQYRLIVPQSYVPGTPTPLLIVYSGTEGSQPMSINLMSYEQQTGMSGFIRACLHGVVYYGNGQAGATVLDEMRAEYDIDNDRTYLMGESAGTTAAEQLGFYLRESYFAAYWANDVTAPDSPQQTAAQIGFAPWGQSGPGGQVAIATQIVSGMQAAGYRVPNPAPYDGTGYDTHGDLTQLQAAFSFFAGKTRQ
jgi:poly(3-hydroxybutyrate) depolymerase